MKRKKSPLAMFTASFFCLGMVIGAIVVASLLESPEELLLLGGGAGRKEITIVGVEQATGKGRLGVLWVEMKEGSGRVLFAVPPFENEDTQKAVMNARAAVEALIGKRLGKVDFVIGLENLGLATSVAGPSMGASVALLMLAAVKEEENLGQSSVRQDTVISAKIDSTGRLGAVGDLKEKYEAVRADGRFTSFIIAETQPVNFTPSQSLPFLRARNLEALAKLALE
ncbi:MAG: hypothetical protein ACK4GQ_01715 [Candidatus Hadarchaeales archaeon]